jgi:hypothetical protein
MTAPNGRVKPYQDSSKLAQCTSCYASRIDENGYFVRAVFARLNLRLEAWVQAERSRPPLTALLLKSCLDVS